MNSSSLDDRKSFLGTSFMAAASMLRVAIQVCALPIVGRLLGPHAYGQIALVSPFIFFAMLIAESGLGACIVRADKVTKELEGTVFCFSLIISISVVVLFSLVAYPIGALVHEPLFPPLLLGMSTILVLSSFTIVPGAILLRSHQYKTIALGDVASALASLAGVVIGIWLGLGVWSLVVQQLSLWIAKLGVIVVASRWRPTIKFNKGILRQHINFGSNLTGAAILSFLARNIDNVLIGAVLGSQALGLYAIAFQIVSLPSMVLSSSVYFTIFSITSEQCRGGNESPEKFIWILKTSFLISAPVLVGIAVTAKLSVPLLLGPNWADSIPLIILLIPLGFAQASGAIASGVLVGRGRADLQLKLGLLSSISTILAIIIGVFFGSQAVAAGVGLTAIANAFITVMVVTKDYKISATQVAYRLRAPLFSSLMMGLTVYAFEAILPRNLGVSFQLALTILIGAVAYIAILLAVFGEHLSQDFRSIKILYTKSASTNLKASDQ